MIPSVQGQVIEAGAIPAGHAQVVSLSNGAEIVVQNLGGVLYHEVEGTLSNDTFNALSASLSSLPKGERDAHLGREISRVFTKLNKAKAISLSQTDEVGYFTFLLPYTPELLSALKSMRFDHSILLNPMTLDRDSLKDARAHTPQTEGLVPRLGARDGSDKFSGLQRIHAPEFVKLAESDIGGGAKVNGSSVALGVTDTGLTLNHPTFRSALDGHNRIEYLKDFTREGRIYFNPDAKFEVTVPATAAADEIVVTAQLIVTPKLPDMPAGDTLVTVKDLKLKVSPELKAILTTAGSGAKLGLLMEESLNSEEDPVDLNGNGKSNDKLLVILIPGATPEQDGLYFDPSGTGDFRKSKRLSDWNTSKTTVNVLAETIGFQIQSDKLPKADGSGTMEVRSASIVGFDPGNHGSHVSGIAAGSKTISNDSDLTLARGVAPEARILLNRVCSNNAGCGATQGILDMATVGGAEVINMSLGGLGPFNDGYGVQETLINRLTVLKNTLFMISAGNSGPGHQTVGSPSTARLSLSIGATATQGMLQRQYEWPASSSTSDGVSDPDQDLMLFFSSRGPTAAGGFKPNLTAPGTELSSVQLNSALGAHAGLDVYWGTSMAAPTATGAYALLLDAIKKYNAAHGDQKLATDVLTLREVLTASARPFDVSSFDPATGIHTSGRYTWVDQGKGMIDLTAAWKKLFELRDGALPTAVTLNGKPVELDYQVIAPAKLINGAAYDGSRAAAAGIPAIGTGVYLDFAGTDTLRQVYVSRRLPENLATGEDAGSLTRQLVTTQDEFVLKTRIYGSELNWLTVGTLDQLNCAESPTSNLTVLSRGAELKMKPDGTGEVVGEVSSSLNICLNRAMIAQDLPQGDNGALIEGYRVVNGRLATLPVYVTVPHKTLAKSAGYESTQTVRSFDVSRNYVTIPQGTSVVKITLEVPALRPGESCSGVELMALVGGNTSKPFATRPEARVSNCDPSGGTVKAAKRKLVFSTTTPKAGVWDVHVFGSYKYAVSSFTLRVDYVNSSTTLAKIEGTTAALTGELGFTVKETSLVVQPDSAKSTFEITGLSASMSAKVAKEEHVIVPGIAGELRSYPKEAKSVTITTGGSKGNDIDLTILECDAKATTTEDPSCTAAGTSGTATDEEKVTFKPKEGKLYAVRVDGFEIHDDGKFVSTETISLASEQGTVLITGTSPEFQVAYSLAADKLAASKIFQSEFFNSGKYSATGALTIRTADETVLAEIPVKINK
jgi:hypothetical protein